MESIYQKIHESKLDSKLETLLLKLLEYNSSDNVREPISDFLSSHQIMSDNFWEQFNQSNTFENALECYYQFSKNQCSLVESLLQTLQFNLDEDNTREELASMLKDALTF